MDYDKLAWEIEAMAHEIRFNHLQTVKYIQENGGDMVKASAEYRASLDNLTTALSVVKDQQFGQRFLAMAGKEMDEEIKTL